MRDVRGQVTAHQTALDALAADRETLNTDLRALDGERIALRDERASTVSSLGRRRDGP